MIHNLTFDYSIPTGDFSRSCCQNCLFSQKTQKRIYCQKHPYVLPQEKIIDCSLKQA